MNMDEPTPDPASDISMLSDEDLRTLIKEAQNILQTREDERRKKALAEMRRLARENGLTFSAKKKPARKRRVESSKPGEE